MNLEKINGEYNYVQNLGNIPKRNYSLSSKVSILNKKPNNNLIQKDYILKLLKTNNQIYKTKPNLSKIDIKSLHINKNEQLLPEKEIKYKLQLQEKNNIINNLMNEIEHYKTGIDNKKSSNIFNKFNDIDIRSNDLNKKLSIKNIFVYSPQILINNNNEEISSLEKNGEKNEFSKFHTLDNEHRKNSYNTKSQKKNNIISILINDNNAVKNEVNLFKKYKYKFPELKKNKLMQKKHNNLTQENNKFEIEKTTKIINKLNILQLNERNNTIEHSNTKLSQSKFLFINSSNSNSISKDNENYNGYGCNEQEMKMDELQKRMQNLICNLFSIIEANKK
jgi:hypothetical protein